MNTMNGATLIELLVACALSLLLLNTTMLAYEQYCMAYRHTLALSRIHNNARLAMYLLSDAIRAAGYAGCVSVSSEIMPDAIVGMSAVHKHPSNMKQDTDAIILTKADTHAVSVQSAENATVLMQNTHHFSSHDAILVSDCRHAERATIAEAVTSTACNVIKPLTYTYGQTAQVSKIERALFYIGDTHRKNMAHMPIYALYAKNLDNVFEPEELIEGVEDLRVKYSTTEGSAFESAEHITDWRQVRRVEMTFLFNGIEPSEMKPKQDHLLRQTWRMQIRLRER